MSLFAQYVKELTNGEVLEYAQGFVWYVVQGDTLYTKEVYVEPKARGTGLCRDMERELVQIAKERGCKHLSGSVIPSNNNSTESLSFLLHLGYKLVSSSGNFIYLSKDIE